MALQALTREVKGAEFTYAKTLTLPFFHSGMVDLPPGGVKRMKNSRKNHMVFWVFSGRVRVDVSGTDFSIGRGGMWQVPRGKRSCPPPGSVLLDANRIPQVTSTASRISTGSPRVCSSPRAATWKLGRSKRARGKVGVAEVDRIDRAGT